MQLRPFVVPGADVARAKGLDLEAAGLQMAVTPRHANVLVLIDPLPNALRRAAVVAWHQMPQPRAVLAVGGGTAGGVPAADASVHATPEDLARGAKAIALALQRAAAIPERRSSRAKGIQHEGMQHGGMQHGEKMSMAAMTRPIPRSLDGLAMERVHSHFGPLFRGLPSGLALSLELDGDSVADAHLGRGLMRAHLQTAAGQSPTLLADILAAGQPLSPAAYRILAWRALESISGEAPAPAVARGRVAMLEMERVASHLGWLTLLATLLGNADLERHAASLQMAALAGARGRPSPGLPAAVAKFVRHLTRDRLFRRRLAGVGKLPVGGPQESGPIARGAGMDSDARRQEDAYAAFGFKPLVEEGHDALARASVRLRELEQSLAMAFGVGEVTATLAAPNGARDGSGEAAVETPRGTARLHVAIEHGRIRALSLQTPSMAAAELVAPMCREQELSDALVSVASLDLSPWEIAA